MTKSDNEPTPETAKKSVLLSEKAPNESQFVWHHYGAGGGYSFTGTIPGQSSAKHVQFWVVHYP